MKECVESRELYTSSGCISCETTDKTERKARLATGFPVRPGSDADLFMRRT